MNKIKVGIIGGTGYTGVELLRLLVMHPNAEVCLITSRSQAGGSVADLFPNLRDHTDLVFTKPEPGSFAQCDVVLSATPNGVAMQHARGLVDNGVKLIDLAADFRLKDVATWEKWYGMQHACPELVGEAIYGLPEVNRADIKAAKIVANPGCYPTATTLGFLPVVRNNLVDGNLIADTKSGVTGAGRSASVGNLYSEVADSIKAYAVGGHRHHPEISQNLSEVYAGGIKLTFVPHLTPQLRGIHATLYADLKDPNMALTDIHAVYVEAYAAEPFVDVMPLGSHPDTRSVKTSNMCRIALHKAGGSGKLVILSVIDNLTKGAAGQAVQNMNIMFDYDESTGLRSPAVLP